MIHFQAFNFSDFDRLRSWVPSEKELIQFAGPIFSYPLKDSELQLYIDSTQRRVCKVIDNSSDEVIGHCEFNFENDIPRISRVLIGDVRHRGKGVGTEIILKMAEEFFKNRETEAIDLNVFAWNETAIKCYDKIGFKIKKTFTFEREVNGEVWKNHNMVLTRHNYELYQR